MITISNCDVIQHCYNTGNTDCVTHFRNGVCLKELHDFIIAFDLLECMTQMICEILSKCCDYLYRNMIHIRKLLTTWYGHKKKEFNWKERACSYISSQRLLHCRHWLVAMHPCCTVLVYIAGFDNNGITDFYSSFEYIKYYMYILWF